MSDEFTPPTGIIRKIIFGTNPKDGKALVNGQYIETRKAKVVDIIKDTNYFKQTGKEKFYVILENKEKVRFTWQEITDVPTTVEYGDPGEQPIVMH